MPELVFFRSGQEVLKVSLERQRMVLGSGEHCDVVIPDPDLSPRQAALLQDGKRWFLEDVSGQGTRVAGKLLRHGELLDGMGIALGQWLAVFRERTSATPERAAAMGQRTDLQPLEALSEGLPAAQVRVKQGTTEFIHELTGDSFTVGKDPDNALVIRDRFISGRHLKVTRRGECFHVLDLNSTNGTYLGGVRLLAAELPLHTVLRVGETELHFEPLSRGQKELSFHGILGTDPCVRQLVEQIQRVAPVAAAVAILGESGTGKELVARALHACSPRAGGPFLPINCAAISSELMESELFGHEKGAFTGADARRKGAFEEADCGTLFLDEVGELPLKLQAKLLRVLESGEIKPVGASRPLQVDVRVVVATHRDLRAWTQQGQFREDLYYRLCGIPLVLPPLRRRRGDIRLLTEHFARKGASEQLVKFTAGALDKLEQHDWPGNIRELRNVVQRAMLLRNGSRLDAADLCFEPALYREQQSKELLPSELPEGMTLEQLVQRLERLVTESALRKFRFNKERTARYLGMPRSTLFKRLKEWGLDRPEENPSP